LAVRLTQEPALRSIPFVFVTPFESELRARLSACAASRVAAALAWPAGAGAVSAALDRIAPRSESGGARVLWVSGSGSLETPERELPEWRLVERVREVGEARHRLRTRPHDFDVVVLDIRDPEVPSAELLRDFALERPLREIPVLVLHGAESSREPAARRWLAQGMPIDVLSRASVTENPRRVIRALEWNRVNGSGEGDAPREAAA
ncbi:MAG: response regulator transcription factor, partial [Candidatus Eisenbacteria bacterium]|nr:response regulator transcription factor [Candidatus Eisenbacteria bacterium]